MLFFRSLGGEPIAASIVAVTRMPESGEIITKSSSALQSPQDRGELRDDLSVLFLVGENVS